MGDRSRLRLIVLRVLVVSLLLTLGGRLWYLQVLAGPQYEQQAADNQVRDIVAAAPRGEILDDLGRPWATNQTALVISVDRLALQRQRDCNDVHTVCPVLQRLSTLLKVPYSDVYDRIQLCGPNAIKGCWNGSPYEPIPVSQLNDDVASTRLALQILERKEDFPGVSAQVAAVRNYPKPGGAFASQVLGYLAPISPRELAKLPQAQQNARRSDLVGASGLEAQYDAYLRGTAGVTQVSVDHLGGVTGTLSQTTPVPGDDVITSLDAGAQHSLEQSLQSAIKLARNTPGRNGGPADFAAGVVLDAQTGHVVAMASSPTYDPNVFTGGISEKQYIALQTASGTPLLDKAYMSAYPPGSSFKLVSSAGLLADGIASTGGTYDCSPTFDGKRNFEGEAFGFISLFTTIVKSCDTVFYRLANADWNRDNSLVAHHKKPVEGVQHVAHAFGIGVNPNIDLPDATAGHIADRRNQLLNWQAEKKNYCAGAKRRKAGDPLKAIDEENCKYGYILEPGDQMNEDIGQGTVLVSPLQLATAYAALVNGGKVFEPRVAKAIVAPNGKVVKTIDAPIRDRVPVSKADLAYIENAMYEVPVTGTAASAFLGFPMGKVKVGGKTGTAEIGANAQFSDSWFASFAGPAGGKPQYVTVIMIDKGGQGGVTAAPSARQIWDSIYGLENHKAVYPNGTPPVTLPSVTPKVAVGPTPSPSLPSPGSSPAPSPSALAAAFQTVWRRQ